VADGCLTAVGWAFFFSFDGSLYDHASRARAEPYMHCGERAAIARDTKLEDMGMTKLRSEFGVKRGTTVSGFRSPKVTRM
jgi:hypothetical protein